MLSPIKLNKFKLWMVLAAALTLTFILVATGVMMVSAANPLITNRFVADPAPYYFAGKAYMYNTDDSTNGGTYWDSKAWRAYSSTDLVTWTDEGAFWKVGTGGFTWASSEAWAPTATYKNGYYWFYLPVDSGVYTAGVSKIGVVRCTAPTSGCVDPIGGPLLLEGREANGGSELIDPFIFVDDNGTPYLFFGGNGSLKMVRLNADMISLNGAITNVTVTGFAEGSWVHKANGIYYLSYPSGWPGPIQYSTSTSIMGPWTFRGDILGSQNTSTHHHGILNYNGQWFLFYHNGALSGWNNFRRSSAITCMYYNADGSILPTTATTAGVSSTSCGAPPTKYTIRNLNSGKCLDVQAPNTADGANVGQYTCNGGAWQSWVELNLGNGYYKYASVNSGKVLGVYGGSTADGGDVIQWGGNVNYDQEWQKITTTAPYFKLKNRNSGKLLAVDGASTADGANVLQWTDAGSNDQQWQLVAEGGTTPTSTPAPTATPGTTTYYSIANVKSAKVMDVPNCSTANSTQLNQWPWLNNNCQKFQFVVNGSYYNVKNANSGKCLDVNSASTADGAKVIQYTCGSGTNQQFSWTASGSYYQLKARHSGKCVNVVSSSTADGALLEQRACSAVTNMQWTRTQR